MIKKRLILASTSPRRIMLLKSSGYQFDVIPHDLEETILHTKLSPAALVGKLAFLKAMDVARKVNDALIIGADTVVLYKGKILGKPKDVQDARRMLLLLSGSEHDIISGVCLLEIPSEKKLLRIGRTHIKMKSIAEEEIEQYIRSGEPMDKAGAYAVQGEGIRFVEKLEGSYSNAVGLPLEILREMFLHFVGDVQCQEILVG